MAFGRLMANAGRKVVFGGAVGAAGVTGAAMGTRGGDAAVNYQQAAFGDPQAMRAGITAGIIGGVSPSDNIVGRNDYYYGQNVSNSSGRTMPVDGSVVFGMFNSRRG